MKYNVEIINRYKKVVNYDSRNSSILKIINDFTLLNDDIVKITEKTTGIVKNWFKVRLSLNGKLVLENLQTKKEVVYVCEWFPESRCSLYVKKS
ncbi:MAG: hypothetical protein ACRC5M_02740 [Anaeroplasmataceae bacterium]